MKGYEYLIQIAFEALTKQDWLTEGGSPFEYDKFYLQNSVNFCIKYDMKCQRKNLNKPQFFILQVKTN